VLLALIAALALTAALGGWREQSGSGPGHPPTRSRETRESRSLRVWNEIQGKASHSDPGIAAREQTRHFALMRSAAVDIPPKLAIHLRHVIGAPRAALNHAQARFARVGSKGFWLVSGRNIVCIAESGKGAVGCDTPQDFSRHGLNIGVFSPPKRPDGRLRRFVVFGVAPDGVRAVRARVGKRSISARVHRNAYMLRSKAPITVLGFQRHYP
jgi:hypothetical protein